MGGVLTVSTVSPMMLTLSTVSAGTRLRGPPADAHGARRLARRRHPRDVALGRRASARPGGLSGPPGWSLATTPRALRVAIEGRTMSGMEATQRRID